MRFLFLTPFRNIFEILRIFTLFLVGVRKFAISSRRFGGFFVIDFRPLYDTRRFILLWCPGYLSLLVYFDCCWWSLQELLIRPSETVAMPRHGFSATSTLRYFIQYYCIQSFHNGPFFRCASFFQLVKTF